jgi:hypothetical protein
MLWDVFQVLVKNFVWRLAEQQACLLEHLQQYYLKHTPYFSVQVATNFHTTQISLFSPAALPKIEPPNMLL